LFGFESVLERERKGVDDAVTVTGGGIPDEIPTFVGGDFGAKKVETCVRSPEVIAVAGVKEDAVVGVSVILEASDTALAVRCVTGNAEVVEVAEDEDVSDIKV
jgi:hypothetical protein